MKAAVVGATGAVGQRFIALLASHPQFKVSELVASERSAGKRYGEAATWVLDEPMPPGLGDMEVKLTTADLDADVVFSAIPGGAAGPAEADLAKRGYKVFSNARDHRMDPKVPLIIAEVNPDHASLVKQQGTDGYVVTNGNCTTIVLTMALKPLLDHFGLTDVVAVSMQALSGAGYPGVPSLDSTANVVPYIGGEEEKVEAETLKFLGTLRGNAVQNANIKLSATCTRVPVVEGHSLAVSVKLSRSTNPEEIIGAWNSWRAKPQQLHLPSAPQQPVHYFPEPNRPQPRRDWGLERGMAIGVGRLRKDPVLGWKFFCSGSNTIRGAAGGSILNAELLKAEGLL
ncbi:MAG TPA: aspartate-semialdehyde dehydrogenase [Candidatus Thermoplasmatota archaeon]|nr:aspartate-semialdehyde dehydrogenase [Candidatus Thermoplasmatota archaeon]